MKPQKIFELKGDDFLKGLSVQPTLMRGGIFRSAPGFDPFNVEGYIKPSLSPTELTAPATNPIKVITNWNSGGVEKIYAHSNSKLYQYLRNSPFTQTDVTTEIDVTAGSGVACTGAILWKNRYIYGQSPEIRSNTLPVAAGSDVQILNGSYSGLGDIKKFCIGADQNLYVGDGGQIDKLTNSTGTAGNTAGFYSIDSLYTIRDLVSDGVYLIATADNNVESTASRRVGNYSCRVYFFDVANTSKTTPDIIYDIDDSYLIASPILDGKVYVFGYNGIYVCNAYTPPKKIFSFLGNSTITKRPATPYQVTVGDGVIYWGDAGTNGQYVFAIRDNIFYTPFITHTGSDKHTALNYSAGTLFAATDNPKIYALGVGSTEGNCEAITANIQLDRPYTPAFVKVTLKEPMTSGQALNLTVLDSSGTTIIDNTMKAFTPDGAKKTLVFNAKPSATSKKQFEDFYMSINPQAGVAVGRVSFYGIPTDDYSQMI